MKLAESSTRDNPVSPVISDSGHRLLSVISRHRIQMGVFALLTLCFAQRSAAQVTIFVTTTQQGVTNGLCSLQEAIYSSEFKSNSAIGATDPDSSYNTGC